ncbi:universal stress protein [Paraburkholderia sp. CNPSo 3274]|uniref:universal stress protein n=1 Tax=Paraburkholderia sp. CNPSo 3274 TaxID=2940932 RepID=UPI0020B865FD|nr:universal stress protein [Paraburkholderia sp. CNPSo 3274]MCP3710059.1 universal stress protein [Paraburkholderia sp. CNPSo 3274]
MELPAEPFQRLMATAEGGSGLVSLAAFACRLANRDAPIKLVELIADPASLFPALQLGLPDGAETHAAMIRRAELDLRDAATALALERREPDVQLLDLPVLHTNAPVAVAHAADSFDADLVVLAAHHPGQRWACRLDPEEIAYATRRTLLYVPSQLLALDEPPLARALIAVDGSASAYAALQLAVGCVPAEVELRVIYVVERTLHVGGQGLTHLFEDDRASTLARAEALVASCGSRVSIAALATYDELDDIASTILREARGWGADLLVIGLQGRRMRTQALPGSVASHALRDALCPVLVAAPAKRATDQAMATCASHSAGGGGETSVRSYSGPRKRRATRAFGSAPR